MYAKTNPSAGRLTPRARRVFGIVGVLIIVIAGGLAAWAARSLCQASFRSQDQISLRARSQCVLAGLGPGGPSASP